MAKQYNTAIIGYGMSAKVFHIPLITVVPEFKLYAIVQRSPKAGDDAEKDHPGIRSFRSTEDMVEDPVVDVVVVTTTPQTHFELIKMALEHGKHGIRALPWPRIAAMLTKGVKLLWKSHLRQHRKNVTN